MTFSLRDSAFGAKGIGLTRETVSLAGSWRFELDPAKSGVRDRWYTRTLGDAISLPGTTDEAQKGERTDERCDDRLSRVWRWIGPAWYQRTITIPDNWAGKRLVLFLERTKDNQVWVDDTWIGSDDSLSTPHRFDLSDALTPGSHRLTILVDNARLPPVGPCHQVDERTQTNWNGIVGRLELQVSEPVWIDDVQLYPRVADRCIRAVASLSNDTESSASVLVTMRAVEEGSETELASVSAEVKIDANARGVRVERELVLPDCAISQPSAIALPSTAARYFSVASTMRRSSRSPGTRRWTRPGGCDTSESQPSTG